MQKIGMFQAKTYLSELIRQVQKGQEICLTNCNQEVAIIISVDHYDKEKKSTIFKKLKNLLKRSPLGTADDIISMKEEGRKCVNSAS